MDIKRVGERGILFTFYELKTKDYDCITNIYAINATNTFFICDTYLGGFYIKQIKEYLENNFGRKKYVVFNSHGHWDHIWGNSEFKEYQIISHELCRKYILENAELDLLNHEKAFAKDKIEICLPNITFTDKIVFEDEGIEFFYSPGHTEDSASCYDINDSTLFVGDNIDEPIPYFMCWNELEAYKFTLESYLSKKANFVVQSHGDVTDNNLIQKNIEYIDKLIRKIPMESDDLNFSKKHIVNLECLGIKKG